MLLGDQSTKSLHDDEAQHRPEATRTEHQSIPVERRARSAETESDEEEEESGETPKDCIRREANGHLRMRNGLEGYEVAIWSTSVSTTRCGTVGTLHHRQARPCETPCEKHRCVEVEDAVGAHRLQHDDRGDGGKEAGNRAEQGQAGVPFDVALVIFTASLPTGNRLLFVSSSHFGHEGPLGHSVELGQDEDEERLWEQEEGMEISRHEGTECRSANGGDDDHRSTCSLAAVDERTEEG